MLRQQNRSLLVKSSCRLRYDLATTEVLELANYCIL